MYSNWNLIHPPTSLSSTAKTRDIGRSTGREKISCHPRKSWMAMSMLLLFGNVRPQTGEDLVMWIPPEGNRGSFYTRKGDIALSQVTENSANKMAGGEYLVCFSEKCEKEDVKQHIIDCLTLAKFSVSREEFEGKTLLTVGAPFETLAQKVRVMVGTCPLPMQGFKQIIWEYVSSFFCFKNYFILQTIFLGGGSWFGENHKVRKQGTYWLSWCASS